MTSDRALLERQMADVELRPFTLDEFHRRRHRRQQHRRIATAAGRGAGGRGPRWRRRNGRLGPRREDDPTTNRRARSEPASPFEGAWVSADTDGSFQTMEIQPSARRLRDRDPRHRHAAACLGAPATIAGTGRLEPAGTLAAATELTCDDGTTPAPFRDPVPASGRCSPPHLCPPPRDRRARRTRVTWRRPGSLG